MSTNKFRLPGKPVLFLVALILIVLITSFPLFFPLLFAVFPLVFILIRGERILKQLVMVFSLSLLTCIIVLANAFFIPSRLDLFLIMSLYFTILLGADFFVAFHALQRRYALLLIFSSVVLSRFALSLSTVLFPFYWTLTMQLLPFMGGVSRFILPLLWEALCVTLATLGYFIYSKKLSRHILFQLMVVLCIALGGSGIVRIFLGTPMLKPGLECVLIQGGYSRQDYILVERHPYMGKRIAQRYLDHIREVANARFLILPESVFPLRQIEDSDIMRTIKDIARLRNEYIMTGILFEEDKKVYNASALINPEGWLQNVYRKRTIVPFVETSTFAKGTGTDTFSVDGHSIAPVICFESVFIRAYFRSEKPELYIVISNDIFAEKTVLSTLHQAYGVINARTMGTPLLQVMQNGPSFYVDSQGGLTNLAKPYERAIGLPVTIR